MPIARLLVAYDGASFSGFAETPGVTTVVGELRRALETIVQQPVEVVGAGRTDAGVHAWGQVISVDLPATLDIDRLARRLNSMCGPAIAVRSCGWAERGDFSARFSATWRHYRYDIWNHPAPNPLRAASAWHVHQPLQLWAMQLACDPLIGEHDFSSFGRRPEHIDGKRPATMRRRVMLARIGAVESDDGPGLLRLEIRANAFCHQMVRSIVGTLIDVGAGRIVAGDMRAILMSMDRANAGQVAPSHGLCLWEVGY